MKFLHYADFFFFFNLTRCIHVKRRKDRAKLRPSTHWEVGKSRINVRHMLRCSLLFCVVLSSWLLYRLFWKSYFRLCSGGIDHLWSLVVITHTHTREQDVVFHYVAGLHTYMEAGFLNFCFCQNSKVTVSQLKVHTHSLLGERRLQRSSIHCRIGTIRLRTQSQALQ